MAKYLVDTTVLIDHFRGDTKASEILDSEDLTISGVTVGELIQGARNKVELGKIEKFVATFDIDWCSQEVNKLAVKLLAMHYLKDGLRLLDSLIAATALIKKSTLITDNKKHFDFIPDLEVITPRIFLKNILRSV